METQAKALARAAQTAAETIATDSSGSYENVTTAEINKHEPSIGIVASATTAYLSAASGGKNEFSVTAKAADGDEFKISRSAEAVVSRACVSPVTKTGCGGAEKGIW